jgi:predicted ATP-grasp superfamily ATP-dependent carboligase
MKLVGTRGNVKLLLIGGAAQWSVAANARQHKRVLAIVKARAERAYPVTREILSKVVADVEKEKVTHARELRTRVRSAGASAEK